MPPEKFSSANDARMQPGNCETDPTTGQRLNGTDPSG